MGTFGDPLTKTPSIQHFLMAMYDILEAHRWAVKKRNVIHRDISIGNIIINTRDRSKPELDESGRPIFINEVLTKSVTQPDLDNGAENDRNLAQAPSFKESLERSPDHERLRRRTGTPRYMARAVAAGCTLGWTWNGFKCMPSLPPDLLELYNAAHFPADVDLLRYFEDCHGTPHGVARNSDEFDDSDAEVEDDTEVFSHLPRHDAESVFWVIVVFLLRALPLGQRPEDDMNRKFLTPAWECIASHEIKSSPGNFSVDLRTVLLEPKGWEQNLHEKLVGLAPMIKELIAQVRPEYSHLTTPPHDFHLQEAMQRILLKYVAKFTNHSNILLNTEEGRTILRSKDFPEHRVSTDISLDGQHLQRARHHSRLSVSQGSDCIIVDIS